MLKELSVTAKSRKYKAAPKHMLTVKEWAKKDGLSERTAYRLLTELCESKDFVSASYHVKTFAGDWRKTMHYGKK